MNEEILKQVYFLGSTEKKFNSKEDGKEIKLMLMSFLDLSNNEYLTFFIPGLDWAAKYSSLVPIKFPLDVKVKPTTIKLQMQKGQNNNYKLKLTGIAP